MMAIFKYRVLFGAAVFVLIGLFFITSYVNKDKINSKSDLVEITANVRDYTFTEHRGLRSHTYHYYLFLHGYNNRFQIIADFVWLFKKKSFEQDVRSYDIIKVYISKKDFENIDSQFNLRVFGIYRNKTAYIDIEDSIEKYNKNFELYGGILFMIIGGIILYFNRAKFEQE